MTLLVIALSIAPASIARVALAVHLFLALFLAFHSLAPTHLVFHPYSGNEHNYNTIQWTLWYVMRPRSKSTGVHVKVYTLL